MTHMTETLTNGNIAQGAVALLLARNINLKIEIECICNNKVQFNS